MLKLVPIKDRAGKFQWPDLCGVVGSAPGSKRACPVVYCMARQNHEEACSNDTIFGKIRAIKIKATWADTIKGTYGKVVTSVIFAS